MVRTVQTTEKTEAPRQPLFRLRCYRCHLPAGISLPTDDGTCARCGSSLIEFAAEEAA